MGCSVFVSQSLVSWKVSGLGGCYSLFAYRWLRFSSFQFSPFIFTAIRKLWEIVTAEGEVTVGEGVTVAVTVEETVG
ncbi:hypothetical protein EON65_50885, partial [archaeon]